MGVCCSSEAGEEHSPYQQQPPVHPGRNNDPASSSQPINSSQPQLQPRPSTNASNRSAIPAVISRREPADRSNRPNLPLKLPEKWSSEDKVWTRKELDKERRAFFDTRVTNEPTIWNAINQVCEVLWNGGDSGEEDAGLGTAQLILDAAEITIPTGHLQGCYDRFGNRYVIPEYIISDPLNIDLSDEASKENDAGEAAGEEGETEEAAQIRRESKGKAIEDRIQIEIKRSDLSEIVSKIIINRLDSSRIIARKVEEQTELDPEKSVKLYYRGHALRGSSSLSDNDWKEGDIISAMVFERDRSQWGV